MTDKVHQSSHTQYQVRVDGKPVFHTHSIDEEAMDKWLEASEANPGCYVDLVSVRTEIIMNLYNYDRVRKHFSQRNTGESNDNL
ncbi:hypothetical protein [Neptuniibacter sp. QD37_11]|uniref:hypothetical protein n=1 Tax=Neptuniibacter sp. QD37_11 TaxID=3398209 RepID=UPI0039F509FB